MMWVAAAAAVAFGWAFISLGRAVKSALKVETAVGGWAFKLFGKRAEVPVGRVLKSVVATVATLAAVVVFSVRFPWLRDLLVGGVDVLIRWRMWTVPLAFALFAYAAWTWAEDWSKGEPFDTEGVSTAVELNVIESAIKGASDVLFGAGEAGAKVIKVVAASTTITGAETFFGFRAVLRAPIGKPAAEVLKHVGGGLSGAANDTFASVVVSQLDDAKDLTTRKVRRRPELQIIKSAGTEGSKPGLAEVTFMTWDPITTPVVEWPFPVFDDAESPWVTARTFFDPMPKGLNREGKTASLTYGDSDAIVSGIKRFGKSESLITDFMSEAPMANVAMIWLDFGGGAAVRHLAPRLSAFSTDIDEGEVILGLVNAHCEARTAIHGNVKQSPSTPIVMLKVDEVQAFCSPTPGEMAAGKKVGADAAARRIALLMESTKRYGKAGLRVRLATQYGTSDQIPSGITSQMGVRTATRLAKPEHTIVALGAIKSKSDAPHTIPADDRFKGVTYGDWTVDGQVRYEPIKAFYVPPAKARAMAKATAHLRVELPWLTEPLEQYRGCRRSGFAHLDAMNHVVHGVPLPAPADTDDVEPTAFVAPVPATRYVDLTSVDADVIESLRAVYVSLGARFPIAPRVAFDKLAGACARAAEVCDDPAFTPAVRWIAEQRSAV